MLTGKMRELARLVGQPGKSRYWKYKGLLEPQAFDKGLENGIVGNLNMLENKDKEPTNIITFTHASYRQSGTVVVASNVL